MKPNMPANSAAGNCWMPVLYSLTELLKKRRDAARKAGRKYGIGFAVVVEPAMSNMGYLSTLLTPETREKAGPKNGATSMVTVNVDPLGAVSVTADVTGPPQLSDDEIRERLSGNLCRCGAYVNIVAAVRQWAQS